jgi:putative ABC transport system permease protein
MNVRNLVNLLLQLVTVTVLNLGNMRFRLGPSLVAVVGFAGVVLVFVGVLSIREGFESTLKANGAEDVAVVLRGGSASELTSGLSHEHTRLIAEAPGVAADQAGQLASAELLFMVEVRKRRTGTDANVPFRGVGERAFAVRENINIVSGRNFEPGRNEIIVGRQAANEFEGLAVGSTARWGRLEWEVVGHFEAAGGLNESEIWTDARVLQDAYNRGNSYQVVYARLRSADSFPMFSDALDRDPRLNVTAQRETEYLADQAQVMSVFISVAGMTIAILMGIGAVFGAINTMYTTVATRAGEIATLRALGFGRLPVLVSVLVEGLVLGLLGGVIGAVIAWLVFNGYQASTLNFQSFSQVAFTFAVTPQLMINGILGALFMGVLGGLMPGIRAARQPVARALRAL